MAGGVYLSVRPSVLSFSLSFSFRVIQLKNCWKDLDEFVIYVMPFGYTQNLYFIISYNR
jgi:hypothetical protein